MQEIRKRRIVRRIGRHKTLQQFLWVHSNNITVGVLAAVFVATVIVAAVRLSAADKPQKEEAERQTGQIAIVQLETVPMVQNEEEIPYPFNLMPHDWCNEDVAGRVPYQIPKEFAQTGGELPECIQQFIYIICNQYRVDYALVLAVIEVESGYKWDADNPEGSKGYMQVNVKWHKDRMDRLNVDNVKNPYSNIMVGVDYLAELQGKFDTEAEVLTAYNYGVAGAYTHVWNKGLTETKYSKTVQQAKERIEKQLGGEK